MGDRAVDFPRLLHERGLLERGVEVGVARGTFAEAMLQQWPGEYHMVDSWRLWPIDEWPDPTVIGVDHEDNYRASLEIAAKFSPRTHVHRCSSEAAVALFRDGSLDFVYIDANHSYKHVRGDIERWLPKVRCGGVLAGHDYFDGHAIGRFDIDVQRAVNDLLAESYEIHVIEDQYPSWWIIRN